MSTHLQQLQPLLLRDRLAAGLLVGALLDRALAGRLQVLLAPLQIARHLAVLGLALVHRQQAGLFQIVKVALTGVRVPGPNLLRARVDHLADVFDLEVDALGGDRRGLGHLVLFWNGGLVVGGATESHRSGFGRAVPDAAVLLEEFVRLLGGDLGVAHRPVGILAGFGLTADLVFEPGVVERGLRWPFRWFLLHVVDVLVVVVDVDDGHSFFFGQPEHRKTPSERTSEKTVDFSVAAASEGILCQTI